MAQEAPENNFWTQQFPRWAGVAAMVGGLLCALTAYLHSLQPIGCIGLECNVRPMRTATGIVPVAGALASLLILTGVAGLALMARQSGRFTKPAKVGLILIATGFGLLFLAALIQTLFFNGDFPGMPFFVVPGVLAIAGGFVVVGIGILRSGVLPRWVGLFLAASSVILLAANEQTAAVLLAIPFGLAMTTAGYFMWAAGTEHPVAPAHPRLS